MSASLIPRYDGPRRLIAAFHEREFPFSKRISSILTFHPNDCSFVKLRSVVVKWIYVEQSVHGACSNDRIHIYDHFSLSVSLSFFLIFLSFSFFFSFFCLFLSDIYIVSFSLLCYFSKTSCLGEALLMIFIGIYYRTHYFRNYLLILILFDSFNTLFPYERLSFYTKSFIKNYSCMSY